MMHCSQYEESHTITKVSLLRFPENGKRKASLSGESQLHLYFNIREALSNCEKCKSTFESYW